MAAQLTESKLSVLLLAEEQAERLAETDAPPRGLATEGRPRITPAATGRGAARRRASACRLAAWRAKSHAYQVDRRNE
jgi:hypothetical protein